MTDPTYKECIENAEFVKMTQTEFGILLERFGKDKTLKAVEKLDNYKGSVGKKYKSDYRAILSWVIDEVSPNGSVITDPSDLKTIKDPIKLMEAQQELYKQGWRFKEVKITTGTTRKWVR